MRKIHYLSAYLLLLLFRFAIIKNEFHATTSTVRLFTCATTKKTRTVHFSWIYPLLLVAMLQNYYGSPYTFLGNRKCLKYDSIGAQNRFNRLKIRRFRFTLGSPNQAPRKIAIYEWKQIILQNHCSGCLLWSSWHSKTYLLGYDDVEINWKPAFPEIAPSSLQLFMGFWVVAERQHPVLHGQRLPPVYMSVR